MISCALPAKTWLSRINSVLFLAKFYEGYGQTECTAGCCLSLPGDWTAGMVGRRAISRPALEFEVGMTENGFLADWVINPDAQQYVSRN